MDQAAPPGSQPPNNSSDTPSDTNQQPPVTPPVPQAEPTSAAVPEPLPGAASPPDSPPEEKKRKIPLLPILIIVGLVVAFAVGLFLLRQSLYKEINKHGTTNHEATMSQMPESSSMQDHLMDKKVLVIGNDPTYAPMESLNEKGEPVGFDIDLGNAIAKEMGIKVQFKAVPWDNIFTSLERQEIDLIISSVSITEERKKLYAFSEPYLNAGQVVVTAKTNTLIQRPEDLTGKKVGAQEETTSLEQAKKYSTAAKAYPDPDAAVADLLKGTLDGVIVDLPAAKGYTDKNPTLKIATDPFTSEYYGIVIKKGDTAMQEHINSILKDLQQKGVLADLKAKWLE
jgi:polar amino acid transport system substrate-binding protein